jgi:hypothetical protein
MLELEESSVSGKTGAMQAELNRSIMTGTSINSELFSGFYGPINRGGLRQPLGAKARPKWGDYIEGLLRPKLKVSEDDLDRVHLD